MKKLLKELENFLVIFFVMALVSSPVFIVKGIIYLSRSGLNDFLSVSIPLLIWATWFFANALMFAKPWKNKKTRREIA